MTLGIFEEIERLIEYIPLDSDGLDRNNIRFAEGVSIDSQFQFHDIDGVATRLGVIDPWKQTVSFRDIIRLLNKFLANASVEEVVVQTRYKQLQNVRGSVVDFPLKNLLFDFCLAALEGDVFDAKLYLSHSLHLLGIRSRLNVILTVIINEHAHHHSLKQDRDIRKLLTLIAMITEPNNIDAYFDSSIGFSSRYSTYLNEIQKLTPIYEEISKSSGRGKRIK
jgi:hypothetical protein